MDHFKDYLKAVNEFNGPSLFGYVPSIPLVNFGEKVFTPVT
jgi:hypothetical protein